MSQADKASGLLGQGLDYAIYSCFPDGWLASVPVNLDTLGAGQFQCALSDVSLQGISIDPTSDMDQVLLQYLNPLPLSANSKADPNIQSLVSLAGPLVGLINATPLDPVINSSFGVSQGLIRLVANGAPTGLGPNFNGLPGALFQNANIMAFFQGTLVAPSAGYIPELRIRLYFSPPPASLPAKRARRSYASTVFAPPSYFPVPYWGRRQFTLLAKPLVDGGTLALAISGVDFDENGSPRLTTLQSGAFGGNDISYTLTDRQFNALKIVPTGANSDRIFLSMNWSD